MKAAARFSRINGGRQLSDGTYAAVISFFPVMWLIPLIIASGITAGLVIRSVNANALERSEETIEDHHIVPIPEMTEPEHEQETGMYEGLYIDIPGCHDITVDETAGGFVAYNPEGNECVMKYEIYMNGDIIATSGILSEGMAEYIELYDTVVEGENDITILTRSFSEDMKTEFNSVKQNVKVIKKQEDNCL